MKIACCFTKQEIDCCAVVGRMTAAMRLLDEQQCGSFAVPSGALGYVTAGERYSAIPFLRESAAGNRLLLSGVPIDLGGSLNERLGEIAEMDYRRAAESLGELDGAYAAIFWDQVNQKLVAVTDGLGIQPLYMVRQEGVFLLATEMKAFGASGLIPVEMEPAGWGAFVSLGFAVGEQTQLAGVKRVEPSQVLIYDPATGSMDSRRYWSVPAAEPNMELEDVDTGKMVRIMRREMDSYAEHSRTGTVLLSGGFDSRLILAQLNRANVEHNALILKHPEKSFGADGRFARRIARKLNCTQVDVVTPSPDYYSSDAYLKFLAMNEVAIPSMNLYITPHVSEHIQPEMKAVWEGLGPGFAFAPAYPLPGGFATYLADRCKDRDTLHWQAVFSVFSDSMGHRMYEGFRQSLQQEISRYSDDEFGVAKFQMASQMRCGLSVSPLSVYANQVLPFTPCLSKELWNLAGRIPRKVTSDHQLYFRVFREHFPEAAEIPICTGGKMVSARGFSARLWLWSKVGSLHSQSRYYGKRLSRVPVLGTAMRKMGMSPQSKKWSTELLDAVVGQVSPDHPDLHADRVRALQREAAPYSWPVRLQRRMLFYWQVWRWIMEGRLTGLHAGTFRNEIQS